MSLRLTSAILTLQQWSTLCMRGTQDFILEHYLTLRRYNGFANVKLVFRCLLQGEAFDDPRIMTMHGINNMDYGQRTLAAQSDIYDFVWSRCRQIIVDYTLQGFQVRILHQHITSRPHHVIPHRVIEDIKKRR